MGDRYKSIAVLQTVGAEKLPAIKGRALWRDTEKPNELAEVQMVYLDRADVDAITARFAPIGSPAEPAVETEERFAFIPTVNRVPPALAADVARWVAANTTDVRSVWKHFQSSGLSRALAGDLLNEWAAQGLLGESKTVTDERPVTQAMLDLLSNL